MGNPEQFTLDLEESDSTDEGKRGQKEEVKKGIIDQYSGKEVTIEFDKNPPSQKGKDASGWN